MNIFHDGQSFHPSSLGISFPGPVCFGIMCNRFSFSFECSVLWCSLFLYCTWNLWVIDMFQIILLLFQVICSLLCHLHPQKICLRKKVRLLLLFCLPIFLCLHYCDIVLYLLFFYVECFWVVGLRKNSHSCMILCTSLGLTTCWIPVEACSVVSSVAAQNMRPWCYNKLSRLCFTLFYSSYSLTLSWTFSILSYLCHGVYQTWNL